MLSSESISERVFPVILSGGNGSRLWPRSRKAYPKQLHCMYGDKTMLEYTAERVSHYRPPIVVCNDDQRFMVAEQLANVCESKPDIILEPAGRNTAPAIIVAALKALEKVPDAILVVLAADHQIKDLSSFNKALSLAIDKADIGKLVAFGVVPTKPETGYGYIKGDFSSGHDDGGAVLSFVEKPDRATAIEYLASEDYLWNSGMFAFKADTLIKELGKLEPGLLMNARLAFEQATEDLDFFRLSKNAFLKCKDVSIDYALMEHSKDAWVVPLDAGWSDLGSWDAVWESSDKDKNGNVIRGDVFEEDCHNSLFHSNGKLLAAIGLDDILVVDTDDALLISHKDSVQSVKNIFNSLQYKNRAESERHRKVYRPWGYYDSVAIGKRYQVKFIEVNPGASLSLQMHHHRAEHWVVVTGTALVQKGMKKILISENESIFIPIGEKHRLSNPGKLVLKLIEVQSGSYLGEDDIVRFDDDFGRVDV